ncbi:hypothetical protein [Inhella proteolytica]|uniref:Tetratricopeptide repeat protein n=1 Tax=Inhella proteolytica TaxID=2795029 RepID=A0A931J4C5_9BURK|nr:hypothetical protein [Inhella proteolytica]MBH9578051.1 hypothetical protein [Inhella proteolytica]
MSAGAFHSRLLRQVEQEIEQAQLAGRQLQAQTLRARRCGLLVRHGQLDLARGELTALYQALFASPQPELAAWLHLAEGLLGFYGGYDSHSARERLLHADAVAAEAGCLEVQVEAQAFLAHLAFVDHQPEQLVTHALAARALAQPEQGAALARWHLVLALAHHLTDSQETAQPWYQRARALAAGCGDDALVSALLYNMAVIRVARLREAELADGAARGPVPMAAVDSITHFDGAMGVAALDPLTPLLRAQVLVAAGQFEQALPLYQDSLPETVGLGLSRLGSSLMADLAWCRARLGQADTALAQARQAELEIEPACHPDDLGITHSRLAQVYDYLGQAEAAERHRTLAAQAWMAWRGLQARWRAALAAAGLQQPS